MTCDEFYAARDNRTLACATGGRFHDATVVLSIDEEEAQSVAGQAAFLIAANLMSRWARRVRLDAPHVPVRAEVGALGSPFADDLTESAVEMMRFADPFGEFRGGSWPEAIRVHVGARPPSGAFWVRGDRWLALAGTAPCEVNRNTSDAILTGAALAACIAVAVAFRRAIGDEALPSGVRLSLWNLKGGAAAEQGPELGPPVYERLLLAGFGAVGSSYAYLLAPLRPRGEIVIVDGDVVDASNLNRSPVFGAPQMGLKKAAVGAEFLRRRGIRARAVCSWLDEAIRVRELGGRFDLVVPVANERAARLVVQQQVPPLQIYGTTNRDWQAFLGRHIPLVEDCLMCRFPEKTTGHPPAMVCSTGSIGRADNARPPDADAALPFLSVAAASLAVAETQKAIHDGFPFQPNFACLDFRGTLSDFVVQERGRRAGCVCANQSSVWERLNGASAFARFSLPDSREDDGVYMVSGRSRGIT